MDKWGAAIMPGLEGGARLGDRQARRLRRRRPAPTPIDGVNHAPFAAFGGWGGGINAQGRPEGEGRGLRLLLLHDASRRSRTSTSPSAAPASTPTAPRSSPTCDLWKKAGMSEEAAKVYLGAIKDSLNSPNMILDLRIPQNQKYQQVVLDEAVSRFLAGEIDEGSDGQGGRRRLERAQRRDRQGRAADGLQGDASAPSSAGSTGAADAAPGFALAPADDRDRRARPAGRPPGLGRAARPPFRPHHGAAGRHRAALLCDLSADHLGLSVAVALRAGAGRLHAEVHRHCSTSRSCCSARSNIICSARFGRSAPLAWAGRWSRPRCLCRFWPLLLRGRADGHRARSAACVTAVGLVALALVCRCRPSRPAACPARVVNTLLLRRRRRRRAVPARPRPGAALRPADPRPQLLPGRSSSCR